MVENLPSASCLNSEATIKHKTILGLDRFKRINETLGHNAGDQLLQLAAQWLLRVVRSDDLVAHFSGDQFAILQINSVNCSNALF